MIESSFQFPRGPSVPNRIAKAPMTERLDDVDRRPKARRARVFRTFAVEGAGLLLTGKVLIDNRSMEAPGNVVIEIDADLVDFSAWADRVPGGDLDSADANGWNADKGQMGRGLPSGVCDIVGRRGYWRTSPIDGSCRTRLARAEGGRTSQRLKARAEYPSLAPASRVAEIVPESQFARPRVKAAMREAKCARTASAACCWPRVRLSSTEALMLYGQFVGDRMTETTEWQSDESSIANRWDVRFAWVLEGRAIRDLWITPPRVAGGPPVPKAGNRYSTTLRIYDPGIDAWHILWANPISATVIRQLRSPAPHRGAGRPSNWRSTCRLWSPTLPHCRKARILAYFPRGPGV